MKLQVHANLQFGRGKTFMKGIYEGDNIPKELIAELKSGSRHISEIAVPNVKPAKAVKKTPAKRQTVRKAPAKKKTAAK